LPPAADRLADRPQAIILPTTGLAARQTTDERDRPCLPRFFFAAMVAAPA